MSTITHANAREELSKALQRATPSEIEKHRKVSALAGEAASKITIIDADGLKQAAEILKMLKDRRKAIESERVAATGPLHQVKVTIDGWFKEPIGALDAAIAYISALIADYNEQARQLHVAALRKSAAELQSGDNASARETLAVANQAAAASALPDGTSVRWKWKWEVINPDIVPCEFRSYDPKLLTAHCNKASTDNPPVAVAGVRFFRQPITTSRKTK